MIVDSLAKRKAA